MTLLLKTFPIGSFACNCSILKSSVTNEAIIIDPGNDSKTLLKIINDEKLKVKYLLHTHAHFDHIGESRDIQEATKAKLCLHQDDQELYDALVEQGHWFGFKLKSPGTVDQYIREEETFGISDDGLNELVKSIHTPGHTPGSCCFYTEKTKNPILFSGDTLFNSSIGRTDLPGGDFEQIIKSIKTKLYLLPEETIVISGHGPETSIQREKRSNPFTN